MLHGAVTDGDADDLMTEGGAALHSDVEAASISAQPETASTATRFLVVALTLGVDILNTAAAAAAAAGGIVVYTYAAVGPGGRVACRQYR